MNRFFNLGSLWLSGLLLVVAVPAQANDSEAETSLGGLVLKQNDAVSMDSEDLYISEKQVRIKYRFTNHSNRDVKALVAFPMPPQPDDTDDFYEGNFVPDWNGLQFRTLVDRKPIALTIDERIEIDGRDVSGRLRELGLPLRWFEDYTWLDKLQKMDPEKLRSWQKEGLITASKNGWDWMPLWQAVTEISREQVFPAGKTIIVEHSYAPYAGGSVGGALHKQVRESAPDILDHYKQRYCVDDYFLRGFDRRNNNRKNEGGHAFYGETWIGYILSSGANWRGPIKDFRLVVDKGSTKNLVSFCMDGVKKIGPTLFEVRKKNFVPKQDLNILIVEWHDLDVD